MQVLILIWFCCSCSTLFAEFFCSTFQTACRWIQVLTYVFYNFLTTFGGGGVRWPLNIFFSCHESNFLSRYQAALKEAFPGQLRYWNLFTCELISITELTHPFLSTRPHSSAFPFWSEHVAQCLIKMFFKTINEIIFPILLTQFTFSKELWTRANTYK